METWDNCSGETIRSSSRNSLAIPMNPELPPEMAFEPFSSPWNGPHMLFKGHSDVGTRIIPFYNMFSHLWRLVSIQCWSTSLVGKRFNCKYNLEVPDLSLGNSSRPTSGPNDEGNGSNESFHGAIVVPPPSAMPVSHHANSSPRKQFLISTLLFLL